MYQVIKHGEYLTRNFIEQNAGKSQTAPATKKSKVFILDGSIPANQTAPNKRK